MTAIRKLYLALAGVTVLTSGTNAFAQGSQPSPTVIACSAIAVPTVVRVQGKTERIGDIILNCTGGTPTVSLQAVPTANFTVQTSQPGPGVTTKELGVNLPAVNGGYPYVESLLAIDDPTPVEGCAEHDPLYGRGSDDASVPAAPASPAPNACPASNTGTCVNHGNGVGGGAVGNSYGAAGNYNIFQGYVTTDGVTHFDGVPIDAPGTNFQMSIRITNIEIDATNLAGYVDVTTSSLDQNQAVTASVGITGTTQLGYMLLSGLAVALPANGIYSGPVVESTSPVCNPNGALYIDVKEGHAAAFKRRDNNVYTVAAGSTTATTPTAQDNWGGTYFTESWLLQSCVNRDQLYWHECNHSWPGHARYSHSGYLHEHTGEHKLYPPTVAYLYGGNTSNVPPWIFGSAAAYAGPPSGAAVLVTTAADGSDAFNPVSPTVSSVSLTNVPNQGAGGIGGMAAITVTGVTTVTEVYEVLWSDPGANETLHIPAAVAYVAGVPTYLNPPMPLTAVASLAPISATTLATSRNWRVYYGRLHLPALHPWNHGSRVGVLSHRLPVRPAVPISHQSKRLHYWCRDCEYIS